MTCATTPMFVDIFGVKVQAVVMYILQQLDSDPSAKFLAFTEFTSQLHLLGLALHLVKVKAELVIDGAPVYLPIHSFKTDPRVRVLILPFTKCAAGINLSEATHVLLVHPFAGQFKTPWDRFGRAGLRFHLLAELPLVESTLNEAESNKNRMRVWAEWEQQCIEMVLQGRNSSAAVRIARFIIQHSVEQAFALHASASNKMGSRNVVDG
ncbi:hypothetical protein BCR44DRAFT_52024 [Catenaria anguillulae PL171]|nr:hypothetical protein BCR44DRAFT_52024 [Catenaria anguillulae PL171]